MIFILNDELRASLRTITMDLFFQAFKKFSYHDFFFQQNDATVVQRGLNPLTLMGDQDRISNTKFSEVISKELYGRY